MVVVFVLLGLVTLTSIPPGAQVFFVTAAVAGVVVYIRHRIDYPSVPRPLTDGSAGSRSSRCEGRTLIPSCGC